MNPIKSTSDLSSKQDAVHEQHLSIRTGQVLHQASETWNVPRSGCQARNNAVPNYTLA